MKKAQVTVFIIVGIILLLTASIIIYNTTIRREVPAELAALPPEVRPVYSYVASCAKTAAEDGAKIMGQQSGYIELPASITRNPASYIPLDNIGFAKLPYWYYEGENRIPTIPFMQGQLAEYIQQNVLDCIGDFNAFKDQFTITPAGELSAEVSFAEENIIVLIRYPIDVSTKAGIKIVRIDEFAEKIPVRLKKAYDLAVRIMNSENDQNFFENVTIDLMTAHPDMPFDSMEIDCSPKRWYLDEIKTELQEVLKYNIPLIRVENTDYVPFSEDISVYRALRQNAEEIREKLERGQDMEDMTLPEAPDDAYEFFHYLFDVGSPASDLKVAFIYMPEFGIDINAQPNDAGVLRSNMVEGARKFLKFLCINQYHFTYDVIYPLQIKIKDDVSFGGDGFIFQFAFPVLINDNEGYRTIIGTRFFEDYVVDTGFCTAVEPPLVDIRAKGIFEGYTNMEIPDVNLTYRCFTQQCELGKTYGDDGHYRLRTYMPAGCSNPFILANKEGYLESRAQLTGTRLDIPITKLKSMDYIVVKHPYFAQDNLLSPDGIPLSQGIENATIYIRLKNETFEQYLAYPNPQNVQLELVDDDAVYDIDILLSRFGDLIGGYNADDVRITYDEIDGKDTVVFHVFEYRPNPITDAGRRNMVMYMLGGNYREQLKPEFE